MTDDEDDSTDDDAIDIDYLKPDEFTDKALAKKYIKSCLSDARDEIRHLLSFLRHSPYGMSEGKEEFKKYIERAEQIYNEINSFLKH